jgi:hypothetical protein
VLLTAAAIIALCVVLDRQDPGGSDPPPRAEAAAARLSRDDVARIARRVERIRRLKFDQPVRPQFVGRERAAQLLREGTDAEYTPREQRIDEESLKLIGLLGADETIAGALESIEGEQVLGFYDDRRKRLVVIREPGQGRQTLELTLAHELVHALEDQRFGFRAHDDLNDDASLGEKALAEGTATAVMADYARDYLDTGKLLTEVGMSGAADTKLPAYVERVVLFPYLEGLQFVEFLRGLGGWPAVDRVLRGRRPSSAEQVMHPDRFAANEQGERIGESRLGPVLGKQWASVAATGVSELDLRAMFDMPGGSPNFKAAEGWAGGRFELWRRPGEEDCQAPCVARDLGFMRVRWDTPYDRSEAEPVLQDVFRRKLGAERAGGTSGVTLWRSRGGAIGMLAQGREVTVVYAPDLALAARVLGSS